MLIVQASRTLFVMELGAAPPVMAIMTAHILVQQKNVWLPLILASNVLQILTVQTHYCQLVIQRVTLVNHVVEILIVLISLEKRNALHESAFLLLNPVLQAPKIST